MSYIAPSGPQYFRGGPPVNDNCANAQVLTVGANCNTPTAGDNSQATQSVAGPTCDPTTTGIYADVWYSFNSGTNTSVNVDLVPGLAMTDNVLVVLDGCTGAELLCYVLPPGPQTVAVTAGTNYIIRIHSNTEFGTGGPFTICVSGAGGGGPPANNDCAGAIALAVNSSCVATAGTTSGATQTLAAITCATFLGDANDDVWYSFTANATTATIEVQGSATFDAVVDLRSSACNGTNISCADATVNAGLEVINATGLTIGAVYRIRVYHYATAAPVDPTFTICVYNFSGGAPPNDLCSSVTPQSVAVPGAITFNGDNTGATLTNDGVLTIAAVWHAITITACADITLSYCGTTPAFGNVYIVLAQQCPAATTLVSGIYNQTDCVDGNWTVYFDDVPAGSYWVPVLSEPGSVGAYAVTVTTLPCSGVGPANNDCGGAINLAVNNTCVTTGGTTAGATQSLAAIICATFTGDANDDVWYSFTATATTATIEVQGSATFDAVIDLRSGLCNGTNIACADATVNAGLEVINATGLTIGAVYFIRVYHYATAAPADPTFTICVYNGGNPPANDDCSSVTAQALSVPGAIAFTGNNTGATLTNDGVLTIAAVWHAFTITACADITLSYCGTTPAFANVYIVLAQQCPAATTLVSGIYNQTDCGDGNWTVYFDDVPAGSYWVPVLSEPGSVGPYTVIASASACAGAGTCDGALVLTSTFSTSEDVCSDGVADVIAFINTSTSTENYDYILTDASDNIISLLAGASFDFETAALGTYHVWGVSYNGVLTNVIPGAPVSGVGSNGSCFDLSTNFVTVNVEICQGVSGNSANTWGVYPNPGNGDFTVHNGGVSGRITMEVLDLGGRLVHSTTVQMNTGQNHVLALAGTLAQGSYTLRIGNGDQRYEQRLVVK